MPEPGDRFRINAAEVTADIIDGEAIIMNLAKGIYYSLDQSGAEIWSLSTAGASLAEIADAISRRHSIPPKQAAEDTRALMEQLIEEKLLLVAAGQPAPVVADSWGEHSSTPYSAPLLNKYSDMKDLLALDPPMPEFKGLPDT